MNYFAVIALTPSYTENVCTFLYVSSGRVRLLDRILLLYAYLQSASLDAI